MKFAELDARAKDKAREWYRDGALDNDWWDFVFDDAVIVLGYLGFDATGAVKTKSGCLEGIPTIQFCGFGSQGDGASFAGHWSAARVDLGKLLEHAPQDEALRGIGTRTVALVLRWPQATCKIIRISYHALHSGTMACTDVELFPDAEDTGYNDDTAIAFEEDVLTLARELADWIYAQLEQEHDYRMSNESVDDGIEANGYEFDEDGQVA